MPRIVLQTTWNLYDEFKEVETTKAHNSQLGYRKSAESAANGAMRPKAQIRTTVKFDKTKTNKRSERE